eukprot:1140740-Pelagomonas_calceolata.AAC.5
MQGGTSLPPASIDVERTQLQRPLPLLLRQAHAHKVSSVIANAHAGAQQRRMLPRKGVVTATGNMLQQACMLTTPRTHYKTASTGL